jgi:predicted nucleic acid-binding protein
MKRVMLDSGPLGKLSNKWPRPDVIQWQDNLIVSGWAIILPEITDFEIRRNLILENKIESIAALDRLKALFIYQPITTATMLKAAELWADARKRGRPTADPKELDADVILAAQAIESGAIIATENVGHLSRYVTAKHWSAIIASP